MPTTAACAPIAPTRGHTAVVADDYDDQRKLRLLQARLAATYPAQGIGDLQAFVVEILITFILVFVVVSVATDSRAPAAIAPIAVGFALAVGVFIAGPVTGGAVNPVRALGPMLVAGDLTSVWLYILGPIIGGVLAALLYGRTMAQH